MHASGLAALAALTIGAFPLAAQASLSDSYPNLQRTLQLTPDQWGRIANEARTFQSFLNDKADRLTQIDQELRLEQLRPAPDPMALGVRHVEAASICRESSDRLTVLRDNVRQFMNAEQQARFDRLESGKTMLPALNEGQNLLLLDTKLKDVLPAPGETAAPSAGWRASRGSAELLPGCPTPAGVSFIGAVINSGSFTQSDRYPNLVRHLELTEAQVSRMVEINHRLAASMGERQLEVSRLRQEMAAEAARDTPSAAALGTRAARLEQICRDGQAAGATARAEMPAVLTESQRARWQELDRALQLLPALGEAQDVNLAGRSPAQALPPNFGLSTQTRSLAWNVFVSPGQTFPGCETGVASARWFDLGNVVPANGR